MGRALLICCDWCHKDITPPVMDLDQRPAKTVHVGTDQMPQLRADLCMDCSLAYDAFVRSRKQLRLSGG